MDASVAAANNAAWCDVVARASGLPTVWRPGHWSTPRRSPDAYPDAVTLVPGVTADDVLAPIDSSIGASVKDSFADLDLAPHGFSVLFEAQWLARAAARDGVRRLAWERVDDVARWWAAGGSTSIRAGVVDDPSVRLLLAIDDDGVAVAAALNASGSGPQRVVGVSNVQVLRGDPEVVWSDLATVARDELGPHPLVGYEAGADLDAPLAIGFEPVGALRVWLKSPDV